MQANSNLTNFIAVVAFMSLILISSSSSAQTYCAPSFIYGCSSWHNNTIQLDSINWAVNPYDCTLNDYTSGGTTLTPGSSYSMQVTNGNWCGCGVWIDLNQDGVFDSTENFFHAYLAVETNTYNFPIIIPSNTPTGSYRMRVIAGWGSDCYNVGSNGYGPCGGYQYGNFDDFTIHVHGIATGIGNAGGNHVSLLQVNPNPVADAAIVSISDPQLPGATLQLSDAAGKIIQSIHPCNQRVVLGMIELPAGIYFLSYRNGFFNETVKLVK